MISLLVSSKTMSPTNCSLKIRPTVPIFTQEAIQLNTELTKHSKIKLQKIMHISPALSEKTHSSIIGWDDADSSPAWYTFVGDVYKGLQIDKFDLADLEFAQQHMGTLSGLYGFLRPMDLIKPYRLELGYKVRGKRFKNLYEFWGDKIAKLFENEVIINLASEEYIKLLRPYLDESQIITPWFMQTKNGEPAFQAIHAKTARGTMARWICKNRINDPVRLKEFAEDRYKYSKRYSTKNKPTFVREFIPISQLRIKIL